MPENIEEKKETVGLFDDNFEFEVLIEEPKTDNKNIITTTEEETVEEQEETTTTENTNSNNQEGDGTSTSSSSSLSMIVTALGEELGIELNQEELEKATDKYQFLRDAVSKWKSEEVKKELNEEQREALDAIKNGTPIKELVSTKVNQKAYANLKDEDISSNVSLQEVLIKNRYLTQGFTEEKANKMIADLKAISEDRVKEEALEAKVFMIEKEKEHEKQLKEKALIDKDTQEKERLASLEKVKTFVLAQKDVIPDFELTESFKEDVFKSMTTAIAKDDKGNLLNEVQLKRSKNPIDFEFKLNLYNKLGLFDEKPDFSRIMKVAGKKVTKGLEKILQEGIDFMPNGKSKQSKEKDENDFGLDIFE